MRDNPVVVLTNERDLAADDVIRRISEHNFPVFRLNIEHAASATVASWRPKQGSELKAGVVWWRQFELPRADSHDMSSLDDLLVLRTQWRSWVATLCIDGTPWMNDLWAARRAENKIEQLRTATRVGFSIPDTLVTNDLAQAQSFGNADALVVKTLAGAYYELTDEGFVYTRSLSSEEFREPTLWNAQPLIVQRKVDGADVRLVMIEGQCFAASACGQTAIDWRLVTSDVEWTPWLVPESIASKCRQYMYAMGLRFAAFDLIDDGHDVWFLEANQGGEWAFIDRPLSLGIADHLASSLIHLANSVK